MALHLWAGNTITLAGTVLGQNGIGLPIDIHAILTFSVREMIGGSIVRQKLASPVGDGSTGKYVVLLDPSDTEDLSGPYMCDMSMLVHGLFYTLEHQALEMHIPVKRWEAP